MMIAQNGPGITNFVTAVKTAYWNHTPMLLVTPQAANKTIGQGGFQEVEQMALFRDMVCYQEEVRDPSRVAEVLNRVIMKAKRLSAPAQINMPRDYWTQVIDIDLPAIVEFERPAGGDEAIAAGGQAAVGGEVPGHPERRGRGARRRDPRLRWRWPRRLDAPVCCNYQHNDSFPGSHPLSVGPARLQRLEGGDGADRQGRRGAGARHPAQPVLDAAGLRHRLLAEERQDHPGRHQPRPHRPDQAGDRRHLRRRQAGRRRAFWRSSRRRPATPAARSARR